MKKLTHLSLFLFIVVSMGGCITPEEHNYSIQLKTNRFVENFEDTIKKVTYEGHEYLVYREIAGPGLAAAMTHSGTCPATHN